MYLLNPVVLRLRQDQILLAYPFNYLSAVNGKATEIVVNYENTKNFTGCDDNSKVNPTCGLKHERGIAIPYSQGFCCFCPELPVNEKQTRGGQDCSLDIGDPTDLEKQKYKASAHCLQLSEIWYTVSALSAPIIIHETYMQVYNQKHLKNGSSVWVALTHDEEFELGSKYTYQYDDNKTIVISYITSSPKSTSVIIPIAERRLLTPQPIPNVELAKLPGPVKNGATDYLLIPKNIINPDGDDCDVSGVYYEAFVQQRDRCSVEKDTCLKKQPLDFWEMDDKKRKAGAKGNYLLENYGIPYKDPIIIHPETKEHWLTLEYFEEHLTILTVEINADEMSIMSMGKHAQISKIISANTKKNITMHVSVLNLDLMPAKLTVQAIKCGFGVPDSSEESGVISPQTTHDFVISTTTGSISLDEKFTCSVEVSSDAYGVIAKREVAIDPLSRCICNFHCECACMRNNLKCKLMEEEDYAAAGFRGSLPVLTAKPPHKSWIRKHPFLVSLAFILFLLLLGFIKGLFSLAGFTTVGDFGMERFLYQPKKIKNYLQQELKNLDVVYDDNGYPINPDTRQYVKVISDEILFGLNVLFCFLVPCIKCQDISKKVMEKKKRSLFKRYDVDSQKHFEDTEKYRSKDPTSKTSPSKADKKSKAKMFDKIKFFGNKGKQKDAQQPKLSVGDSQMESTGPVADPLNKELERWQKGTTKIQTVVPKKE